MVISSSPASLGAGATSTAVAVAPRSWPATHPADTQVYAIGNDPLLGRIVDAPHCGGVVTLTERERLERLVRMLLARVQSPSPCHTVLVVDGLPAVRNAIDALGGDLHERFDELLVVGPSARLTAVVTSDQTVLPLAATARATQRWVLRLADTSSAAMLDLRAAEAVGADAPPGRLIALPERLEAQVVAPEDVGAWPIVRGRRAPTIDTLPTRRMPPRSAAAPATATGSRCRSASTPRCSASPR